MNRQNRNAVTHSFHDLAAKNKTKKKTDQNDTIIYNLQNFTKPIIHFPLQLRYVKDRTAKHSDRIEVE